MPFLGKIRFYENLFFNRRKTIQFLAFLRNGSNNLDEFKDKRNFQLLEINLARAIFILLILLITRSLPEEKCYNTSCFSWTSPTIFLELENQKYNALKDLYVKFHFSENKGFFFFFSFSEKTLAVPTFTGEALNHLNENQLLYFELKY